MGDEAIANRSRGNAPASSDALAVEVSGLTKSYGRNRAVDGIDLRIERGEIFALLGPNGAGKTSTVEILEGYRSRDAGSVSVLGFDPARQRQQIKSKIGIVLQSTGVDNYLTVAETITMYAGYYPHPKPTDEVIALVGLQHKRDSRVNKLSGGQQRRLDVAIALSGNPDLLFLDEPTTGFDPSARHEAWQVVKDLAALGKTVVLTTHYMDEAQYLADRVAVIAAGKIVAEGPPSTIGERELSSTHLRYLLPSGAMGPGAPGSLLPPADLMGTPGPDGVVDLAPDDLTVALHRLTGWSIEQGIRLDGLEIVRPSLEDVYLALTGQQETAADPDLRPARRPRRRLARRSA